MVDNIGVDCDLLDNVVVGSDVVENTSIGSIVVRNGSVGYGVVTNIGVNGLTYARRVDGYDRDKEEVITQASQFGVGLRDVVLT